MPKSIIINYNTDELVMGGTLEKDLHDGIHFQLPRHMGDLKTLVYELCNYLEPADTEVCVIDEDMKVTLYEL